MFFLLYSHNQLVSGKDKSAIYDLDKSKIYHIPNVLVELLEAMRIESIQEIKNKYTPKHPEIIDRYTQYLLDNKLGFFTKFPKQFPEMKLDFFYPGDIREAVVETDLNHYDLENVFDDLHVLKCRYLELRIDLKNKESLNVLYNRLEKAKELIFVSVILIIKHTDFLTESYLIDLYNSFPKIRKIIVYDSPKSIDVKNSIQFTTKTIVDLEENNKQNRFIVNLEHFIESKKYDSTYNKRIAITYSGDIKNILNDKETFGNYKKDSLKKIAKSIDFQKKWNNHAKLINGLKGSPLRFALYTYRPLLSTKKSVI